MISFCLLFSVNLPFLPLSFSLAASFAAKTTFSVEPREFSMLTARCLATLPAKEIREQKVQVGSGVGGGEGELPAMLTVSEPRALRFFVNDKLRRPFPTSLSLSLSLFSCFLCSPSYFRPFAPLHCKWAVLTTALQKGRQAARTLCKYLTWTWVKSDRERQRRRGLVRGEGGIAWQVNSSFFGPVQSQSDSATMRIAF